jgi:DNA polymerase/3'-5' exonuclease PolX
VGGDKQKWPLEQARAAAEALVATLAKACERIVIAGSVRREKPLVGDVEIVYIPRVVTVRDPDDLFADKPVSRADEAIALCERTGLLSRRLNALGRETYGPRIKLMRAEPHGLPVDLFEATADNWHNYLVCRTGPAESNIAICERALRKGYKWAPYSAGFVRLADGAEIRVSCEREVFEFVGLPYREPHERTVTA